VPRFHRYRPRFCPARRSAPTPLASPVCVHVAHGRHDRGRIAGPAPLRHIGPVAEARSESSSLGPRIATPDLDRFSSLGPGPPGRALSSSLALCPHYRFGFGPIISPIFGWGFFLPVCPAAASRSNAPAYLVDRLSLCLTHSSYSLFRVALTDRAIYISPCRCDAVRFLLPRTCVARHRVQAVSSSLGLGPPGPAHLLLPCAGPLLAIWLRPYPWPHLRMGPFFLPHPLRRSLRRQHWPAPP
jgi:hypothetical protein